MFDLTLRNLVIYFLLGCVVRSASVHHLPRDCCTSKNTNINVAWRNWLKIWNKNKLSAIRHTVLLSWYYNKIQKLLGNINVTNQIYWFLLAYIQQVRKDSGSTDLQKPMIISSTSLHQPIGVLGWSWLSVSLVYTSVQRQNSFLFYLFSGRWHARVGGEESTQPKSLIIIENGGL